MLSIMKLTRTGMVIAVFFVGCATGGAASQFVVPKAQARDVLRWDYLCIEAYDLKTVAKVARKAGREGWEMAASAEHENISKSTMIWCFKRPK